MTDTFTMTVDEMRRVDDRIDSVCRLAERLMELDPEDSADMAQWHMLKPLVMDLVGWDRDRPRLRVRDSDRIGQRGEAGPRPEPVSDVDKFLRSARAYELILQHVTGQDWSAR